MKSSSGVSRFGPCLAITVCLIALPGSAPVAAAKTGSEELIISGSTKITDAPTWIAAAAGYFDAAAGPPIRVELADSGQQSLERLMAGEADFALTAAVPMAMALTRLHHDGASPETWPVVVASIGLSSRAYHVIASADHGIEQPADLPGHVLGLLLDASPHFAWDRFADLHGIGAGAVRLVNSRPDELAGGLADGRFAGVVAWSPFSELIMDQLGASARSFPLQAMDSMTWLLVCRRSLASQHPQLVERVLRGYAEAIDLVETEPDHATALLDRPPNWLQDKRVAWKLALNWPVIVNMEVKLEWSASRLGMTPLQVSPRHYIAHEPLDRFRPEAVSLPTWIADGDAQP